MEETLSHIVDISLAITSKTLLFKVYGLKCTVHRKWIGIPVTSVYITRGSFFVGGGCSQESDDQFLKKAGHMFGRSLNLISVLYVDKADIGPNNNERRKANIFQTGLRVIYINGSM